MSEENQKSAFVCPECGKAIQRDTIVLLSAMKVNCDHCGHEIALDRRAPKTKEN